MTINGNKKSARDPKKWGVEEGQQVMRVGMKSGRTHMIKYWPENYSLVLDSVMTGGNDVGEFTSFDCIGDFGEKDRVFIKVSEVESVEIVDWF